MLAQGRHAAEHYERWADGSQSRALDSLFQLRVGKTHLGAGLVGLTGEDDRLNHDEQYGEAAGYPHRYAVCNFHWTIVVFLLDVRVIDNDRVNYNEGFHGLLCHNLTTISIFLTYVNNLTFSSEKRKTSS